MVSWFVYVGFLLAFLVGLWWFVLRGVCLILYLVLNLVFGFANLLVCCLRFSGVLDCFGVLRTLCDLLEFGVLCYFMVDGCILLFRMFRCAYVLCFYLALGLVLYLFYCFEDCLGCLIGVLW